MAHMGYCQYVGGGGLVENIYGWLSKLWSFFGYPKY